MNDNKGYYWLDDFGGVNGPDQWSRLQELWSRNVISNETELCAMGEKDWVKYKAILNPSKPISEANQRLQPETDEIGTNRKPSPLSHMYQENPHRDSPTPSLTKLKISLVVCSTLALLFVSTCIWLLFGNSRNLSTVLPDVLKVPLELNIEGSVFIVTKGKDNVKLGLVPILACESHALHECLTRAANVCAGCADIIDFSKPLPDNYFINEYTNCVVAMLNMIDIQRESIWKNIHKKIKTQNSVRPQILSSVMTDADGKFKLSLKSKHKCSLLAFSERQVVNKTEQYLWIIPLTSESTQNVIMSNHNMIIDLDKFLFFIRKQERLPIFDHLYR